MAKWPISFNALPSAMTDVRMDSWFRDRLKFKRAVIALLFAVTAACIWCQREVILIWLYYAPAGRTVLPPFDVGKAAGLSNERRAELEREFFTEVYLWNTDSRRYNGPDALNQRELRWREMAEEGFELAYLALTAFEPRLVRRHSPLPALRRLKELARQGDAGAMCLIPHIVLRLPSWGNIDWTQHQEQARFWMQKGADAGHPECMIWLGARLLSGSDGFARNGRKGMELLTKSFDGGYLGASSTLKWFFQKKGFDDARNRRISYCWAYQAEKFSFSDADLSIRVYINEAPRARQEALMHELEQLREWQPKLKECLDLTKRLEGG